MLWEARERKTPLFGDGAEQELELAKESSFGAQSFGRYQGIRYKSTRRDKGVDFSD